MRLQGNTALITGGARGVGLAIATALAREGAVVAIADIDVQGANEAAARLKKSGAKAHGFVVNVADARAVEALMKDVVTQLGRVDFLVNNAGVGGNTPFLDTTLESWNRIVSTNLTGAFFVAQAGARQMVQQGCGGRIINVASLSGQRGGHGRSADGSAMAGLEVLSKVMAVELAEHGINVNIMMPSVIETGMPATAHDEETRAADDDLITMVCHGTLEQIGDAAVFLCMNGARTHHPTAEETQHAI